MDSPYAKSLARALAHTLAEQLIYQLSFLSCAGINGTEGGQGTCLNLVPGTEAWNSGNLFEKELSNSDLNPHQGCLLPPFCSRLSLGELKLGD